jgi:hypothetical protein
MTTEKRHYPRVEITWPVTVITPNGPKVGRIQNISLGGALIQLNKTQLWLLNKTQLWLC